VTASGEQSALATTAARERRTRLDPDVFRLPEEKIREGWCSDAYFNYSKQLLEGERRRERVTMRVFQKPHSVLDGDRRGDRGAQALLGEPNPWVAQCVFS
jgi:hypothetical protein